MSKPWILDLFCKAGGAAKGYADAGFEVVGVDIEPQPNYPYEFVQHDAMTFFTDLRCDEWPERFDAVHASPPCQRYTSGARMHGTSENHPDLVAPTRLLLARLRIPYVIENVMSAPLSKGSATLCGTMFDLGVFRHRKFESNWSYTPPPHPAHAGRVGDGKYHTVAGHAGGSSSRDGWEGGSTADWAKAMDIDWMTGAELAQAIPPAYTRHIGTQLQEHLCRQ